MSRFKSVDDLNPKVRGQAARKAGVRAKRNKHNAKKTPGPGPMGIGEVVYDSKKEAKYAEKLESLRKQGLVRWWTRQVRFVIPPKPGEKKGALVVDFEIHWSSTSVPSEYHDVKGMRSGNAYKEFKRKAKVVKDIYGVEIIEV